MDTLPEDILSYRNELLKIYEKSTDLFEKQLSYISGGALGLTYILIEKIFPDISKTHFKGVLILSWILLGLTLFINLISHIYAMKAHSATIDEINRNSYDYSKASIRNKKLFMYNYASIALLFGGILLFILYTSVNIVDMKNDSKPLPRPDQTRGLPTSPPPRPNPSPVPQPGTGVPSTPPPPPPTRP